MTENQHQSAQMEEVDVVDRGLQRNVSIGPHLAKLSRQRQTLVPFTKLLLEIVDRCQQIRDVRARPECPHGPCFQHYDTRHHAMDEVMFIWVNRLDFLRSCQLVRFYTKEGLPTLLRVAARLDVET